MFDVIKLKLKLKHSWVVRTAAYVPDLNHAVLEGPLGELVALLIHDHPIHHVGVPQGLGPHQEGHIVCVPSDSSQSPALQLQAVDDAVLLPVPTQLDGEL
jgi:hypothetical protein